MSLLVCRGYCFQQCNMVDPELTKGRFLWQRIASAEEAMEKIRTYGAVVTRFNIFSDFKDFFKRHPRGVYYPGGPSLEDAFLLQPCDAPLDLQLQCMNCSINTIRISLHHCLL